MEAKGAVGNNLSREEQLRIWQEQRKAKKQNEKPTQNEYRLSTASSSIHSRTSRSSVSSASRSSRSARKHKSESITPLSNGHNRLHSVRSFEKDVVASRMIDNTTKKNRRPAGLRVPLTTLTSNDMNEVVEKPLLEKSQWKTEIKTSGSCSPYKSETFAHDLDSNEKDARNANEAGVNYDSHHLPHEIHPIFSSNQENVLTIPTLPEDLVSPLSCSTLFSSVLSPSFATPRSQKNDSLVESLDGKSEIFYTPGDEYLNTVARNTDDNSLMDPNSSEISDLLLLRQLQTHVVCDRPHPFPRRRSLWSSPFLSIGSGETLNNRNNESSVVAEAVPHGSVKNQRGILEDHEDQYLLDSRTKKGQILSSRSTCSEESSIIEDDTFLDDEFENKHERGTVSTTESLKPKSTERDGSLNSIHQIILLEEGKGAQAKEDRNCLIRYSADETFISDNVDTTDENDLSGSCHLLPRDSNSRQSSGGSTVTPKNDQADEENNSAILCAVGDDDPNRFVQLKRRRSRRRESTFHSSLPSPDSGSNVAEDELQDSESCGVEPSKTHEFWTLGISGPDVGGAGIVDEEESIEDDLAKLISAPQPLAQVSERSVLHTVREHTLNEEKSFFYDKYCCASCETKDLEIEGLKWQTNDLLIEKRKVENKLFAFRKGYENRVGPFRTAFEELSTLRAINAQLERENREINANLQSTVAGLQQQMTEALTTALQKKNEMESKLNKAESTIRHLRSRINGGDSGR